jgi:putative transposase
MLTKMAPTPLGGWDCGASGVDWLDGSVQAWRPYGVDCKYHLVWVTKYRYPVLGGDVGLRCRELLRETARAHEMVVHAGSVNREHVHMPLSVPPRLSVSRAVQYLKGRSSHKLLSEFGILRKRYWGQHLWARGYWVVTSGNVTDEMWADYIKNQTTPEPDDNFNVT